jgi:glycosyltransferase involved in cell wall biosynthesis
MERPEVSVVMAVYNERPYLREAVESILDQTFRKFEFIIVDDGSTDGSADTLEEISKEDSRVRVFHLENQGPAGARNYALRHASGRYIAIMDGDDISLPERFEQQVRFLDKNPDVGILGTQVEVVDEHGEHIDYWSHPTDPATIAWRILFNACLIHSSVMMRRSLVSEMGGYAEWATCSHDHELWTRAVLNTRLTALPQTLLKFRLSENSITALRRREQMQMSCEAAAELHRALLGSLASEKIAHFLVWMYQFNLERAIDEADVDDFRAVFEYLGRLYRAHRDQFGPGEANVAVRRELLPRLDLMASKIAEEKGWSTGVWYKVRARLMRPTYEVFPWLWQAAREKLMPTRKPGNVRS